MAGTERLRALIFARQGRKRGALPGLALAAGLLLAAPPAAAEPLTRGEVEALVPKIEAYVENSMGAWDAPGMALGIVAEDELVYARGFGVREIGVDAPVTPETVFQIGSTTKAFLGVTEAALVEEGRLSWDDRVVDHYPTFQMKDPWVTREFRILDLLAQRSGLPGYFGTSMQVYGYDADQLIAGLAHVEPETSFRSSFAYQNAFHLVAGRIVADRAGTDTWADYLTQRLLDPLGMTATTATEAGLRDASNRARGHRQEEGSNIVDPLGDFPYVAEGAGALNSNIHDLARWLRFHINGGELDGKRVLESETLAKTYEPLVAVTGGLAEQVRLGEQDGLGYATGWVVHNTPEGRAIEHAGGTIGFISHVAFDPDREVGVAVLVNQSWQIGGGLALPMGRYILDLLQGRTETDYAAETLRALREASQPGTPPARDDLFERPLEAYVGRYESPVLGQIDIALGDDTDLKFTLGPRAVPVRMTRWAGDSFTARIPAASSGEQPHHDRVMLQFLPDRDGAIRAIHWDESGDQAGQPPLSRIEEKAGSHSAAMK